MKMMMKHYYYYYYYAVILQAETISHAVVYDMLLSRVY